MDLSVMRKRFPREVSALGMEDQICFNGDSIHVLLYVLFSVCTKYVLLLLYPCTSTSLLLAEGISCFLLVQ
jgi:hypothetical protein